MAYHRSSYYVCTYQRNFSEFAKNRSTDIEFLSLSVKLNSHKMEVKTFHPLFLCGNVIIINLSNVDINITI